MKSNNQIEYFKSLLNSSLPKEEIITKIEEEFYKIREDIPIGVKESQLMKMMKYYY